MATARSDVRAFLLTTAIALLLAACTEKHPCDEGQVLRDGYCYPADASVARDATPGEPAVAAFGQTCTSSAECGVPANYCAIQPGQSSGFCSAFGCDQDATVCPSTWTCMDLTPYGLAAHLCVPSQ